MNTMDPLTQKLLAQTAQRRAAAARKRSGSQSDSPVTRALAKFEPKRRCFEDACEQEKENVSQADSTVDVEEEVCAKVSHLSDAADERAGDCNEPEVQSLTSPTHRELSDTLRKQHLQDDEETASGSDASEDAELEVFEGVVEAGRAGWEALERLLSPEREESICSSQLSAELTRTLRRTSQSQISESAGSAAMHSTPLGGSDSGRESSSAAAGEAVSDTWSTASGDVKSDSERVLARSSSVTMMLQNAAIRAQYRNDAIKLLLQECLIQQDIERQASHAIEHCVSGGEQSGVNEELEAERLLRIACERRQGCLAKVDELRVNKSKNPNSDSVFYLPPSTADITLSGIQLPLNPEFLSKLKNRPDRQCHSFFCLVRLDQTSVTGSHLISTNDQQQSYHGGLKFTNKIILHSVCPSFKINVEVYGMQTSMSHQEFKSLYGAPSKKQRLQSMLSTARLSSPVAKRKLQALFALGRHRSQPDSSVNGQTFGSQADGVRKSRFACLGRIELTLSNCRMTTFQLSDLNCNSLLGPVHLHVQLDIQCNSQHKGFLTLHDGLFWQRRWSQLENGVIQCWKCPDNVDKQDPSELINLKDFVGGSVSLASRDDCARQHAIALSSIDNLDRRLMAADTKEDCLKWMSVVTELLDSLTVWKSFIAN